MHSKIVKADFGQFIFLDEHTVVAEAYPGVNIDGQKVQYAIELIEQEVPDDYALIFDRKADYSIMPVEVYQYFAGLEKLRAIAIVTNKLQDFLPDNMEQRIYKGPVEKFSSIVSAYAWVKALFGKSAEH